MRTQRVSSYLGHRTWFREHLCFVQVLAVSQMFFNTHLHIMFVGCRTNQWSQAFPGAVAVAWCCTWLSATPFYFWYRSPHAGKAASLLPHQAQYPLSRSRYICFSLWLSAFSICQKRVSFSLNFKADIYLVKRSKRLQKDEKMECLCKPTEGSNETCSEDCLCGWVG